MLFDFSDEKSSIEQYSWLEGEYLSVSEECLSEIKEKFTKEDFYSHVAHLIHKHQLPFPYFPYNESEERGKFAELCVAPLEYSKTEWESNLISLSELTYKGQAVLFPTGGLSGNSLSDMFTQKVRLEAVQKLYAHTYGALPSVWDYIRRTGRADNESVRRLLRNAYLESKINQKTFIRAARLSGQMVTQFRPSVAKTLYDFFGAKNVLDFSAGWGDRLVGFLASRAESYIGIDPNTQLHEPYRGIHTTYAPHKKTRFICSPAEEVDYSTLEYDFVFTSPPYFDLEIYSSEGTQSINKFPSEEGWREGFLFETLSRVYQGLKQGGRIAINICDNPRYEFSITSDLVTFLGGLGATYAGVIGYDINKRPGVVRERSSEMPRGEPILIWSKGVADEPKWHPDTFF
jgi:hypothetical protein